MWKSNGSLRQLQGSRTFWIPGGSYQGKCFFGSKIFSSTFHRRCELFFSAVRHLNRDIYILFCQWYCSWKLNLVRIVWKISKNLSTIERFEKKNKKLYANFEYFTIKKNTSLVNSWVSFTYVNKKCRMKNISCSSEKNRLGCDNKIA